MTVIRRLLRCTLNTGLISNLVIELGLQADEEVAGETEAELGTEGEVGAWFRFHGRLVSVSVFDSDEISLRPEGGLQH